MIATLWRMALRNARRHRAQAVAAAATVMVGTTVLAASLAAGQAAENGIRQVAFDVLGEVDELVRSEGDFYFPAAAAQRFTQLSREAVPGIAVGPTVTHVVVAGTPDGRTEPDVLLVGLAPGERGLGEFRAERGTADLSRGALVNARLAERLGVQPGDVLDLRYAPSMDPVVPTVHRFAGNVTSTGSGLPLPGGVAPPPPGDEHTFDVPATATRIVAVLAWGSPGNATDLDITLAAPSGRSWTNANGTAGSSDAPAILNATAEEGSWTARVTAKAAVEQEYRLFVVVLRPAFSLEELREARDAVERLGPLGERFRPGALTGRASLTVAGVVAMDGKGGLFGEPAVFLPLADAQRMLDRSGDVNLIRVSNPGGVRDGLTATPDVMPGLHSALNATKAAFTDDPSVQALGVEPTKQQIVRRAELAGSQFTQFLTTLSSFTILAGVLLIVNLFTMLGEERRVELAVMRALGLHRRHLVGSLSLEGLLYGLPGAPVGGVLGIGLAWVLIKVVNDFISSRDALPIPFVVAWWTPLVAAVVGLLLTAAAVVITGARLSRLHIAAGLKGLPDPARGRRSLGALALLALGAALTPLYLATGWYSFLVFGPAALLYGGALLAGRRWRASRARFLGAALVIPYGLWTIAAFTAIGDDEAPYIAPLRGTLLVIMAVVLLLNLPGLPRALKAVGRRVGRAAPATMVALAYPTTRQLRTGLTASMFALVLLVLAVFSTFFGVFSVDPEREAGGYDVYATTTLPIEDLDAWAREEMGGQPASLRRTAVVDHLVVARVVGGDTLTIDGGEVHYNGPPIDWFYGVDEGFAEHNEYALVSRLDAIATDEQAYHAVAMDPSLAIVSRMYDVDEVGRLGRIHGGETLRMRLVSGDLNFTVVGAQEQLYLGGVFLAADTVRDLFPSHGSGFLVRVAPGEDPVEVAAALERDFSDIGLDAASIREETLRLQELDARLFAVLQVFLGLGLVIGVASLGIVTAKSALEREHELGVLRALGLPARHVTWSLVTEALFTAALGILPGILIGIAVSYAAFMAFFANAGVPFTVPWASIVWLTLISLGATLASTVPPARRAARTELARSVRVTL